VGPDGGVGQFKKAQTITISAGQAVAMPTIQLDKAGTITGVVDWEFAHSGSSYEDLGNLLRFETDEPFASAVVRTFADLAPSVSPRFVELGRAVDLFALIELAARTDENPVVDRARQLLREIVRTGDLSAGRPAWA